MAGEKEVGRNRWRFMARPEMVVGLSAVVLSVCGLFVAVYQATLEREQARAAVWPHAEVTASLNPGSVRLWVQNTGVGPARIRAAAVRHEGELVGSWSRLLERLEIDIAATPHYQSMIGGRVLPGQSDRELVFAITPEDGPGGEDAADAVGRAVREGQLDVAVCYCSVYDECWTASLQEMIRRWRGEAPAALDRPDDCDGEPRSAI